MRFLVGDPVAAATCLRRGFVANGYIAELLSGNPDHIPLAIWHDSNFAEPATAHAYMHPCGDLWRRTRGAIAFVRWLHTHPKILVERAASLECQEALLWEYDPAHRRGLLDREQAVRSRIDDILSREIVRNRADRRGRPVEPWFSRRMLP